MSTFELTLLEICAQNQGNSVSGDLKCKNFPGPPKGDHLRRSIITIQLLRNDCQLLEKLWTTLFPSLQGAKCITVTQDTSPSGVNF